MQLEARALIIHNNKRFRHVLCRVPVASNYSSFFTRDIQLLADYVSKHAQDVQLRSPGFGSSSKFPKIPAAMLK